GQRQTVRGEPALGVGKAGGIVHVVLEHGRVGGAKHRERHLVGDGEDGVLEQFERDWVSGGHLVLDAGMGWGETERRAYCVQVALRCQATPTASTRWKAGPPLGGTGSSPISVLMARFSSKAQAGQIPSTMSVAWCWPASSAAFRTTEPRRLPMRTRPPAPTPSSAAASGCIRRTGAPSLAIEVGVSEKVELRKFRAGGQASLWACSASLAS